MDIASARNTRNFCRRQYCFSSRRKHAASGLPRLTVAVESHELSRRPHNLYRCRPRNATIADHRRSRIAQPLVAMDGWHLRRRLSRHRRLAHSAHWVSRDVRSGRSGANDCDARFRSDWIIWNRNTYDRSVKNRGGGVARRRRHPHSTLSARSRMSRPYGSGSYRASVSPNARKAKYPTSSASAPTMRGDIGPATRSTIASEMLAASASPT